jgi:hypothetical protein
MSDSLDRRHLAEAFAVLGARLQKPSRVLIGGAGALILGGELQRATVDCDVLLSQPDIGQLQADIRAVAEHCGLVGGWLNGSAQTYAEILPPDYESRLHSLPMFGRLQVMVLHRQDVIVMKLFAGRPRDLADIAALVPTAAELEFARRELPRLTRIDPARTDRMRDVLDGFSHAKG